MPRRMQQPVACQDQRRLDAIDLAHPFDEQLARRHIRGVERGFNRSNGRNFFECHERGERRVAFLGLLDFIFSSMAVIVLPCFWIEFVFDAAFCCIRSISAGLSHLSARRTKPSASRAPA